MQGKYSVVTLTVIATAALAPHRFVADAGTYAAANGSALGVTRSEAAIGADVPVDALGTTIVEAGGAITRGAAIKVGSTGKALAHDATNVKVGRALSAAAADGDLVEVLLIPNA